MNVTVGTAAASVVLMAVMSMAGCAAQERPRTIIPTNKADSGKVQGPEKLFVDGARAEFDYDDSDKELVAIGEGACNLLERGASVKALHEEGRNTGLEGEEYGAIVWSAAEHLCPAQLEYLTTLVN